MRLAALFSGGKDSNRALEMALEEGHEVSHLVTVFPDNTESYMYQTRGLELARLAAEAIGIPLVEVQSSGEKEIELDHLRDAIAPLDVDGVISGALRSNYQRSRVDRICEELDVEHHAPLWGRGSEVHVADLLGRGYEMVIVAVAALGLDESLLGKVIDGEIFERLAGICTKCHVNIDGEGGEYETSVLYGPHFRKRVVIEEFDTVWELDSGHILVRKAELVEP